jgi:hypothetical protein
MLLYPRQIIMRPAIESATGVFLSNAPHQNITLTKTTIILSIWFNDTHVIASHITPQITAWVNIRLYPLSPLFKKEWHTRRRALIPNRPYPIRVHWPGAGTCFATEDDGIETISPGAAHRPI